MTKNTVRIYSDGACRGNPGPGGWGVVLRWNGHQRELSGGEARTTNNRMELTAAIRGLEALSRPCAVELYTDSQYVKHGIEQWLAGWKRRGWRTASGGPVKNVDLWQRLENAVARHVSVTWHWVRGHSGVEGNELADRLANRGIDDALARSRAAGE